MAKKRIHYLSLMSIISAFAVVMLHTNGCFWSFSTERYWVTANIIESVMYFAVPVFFMITGATLIDYRERYSTKQYVEKRIQKTVVPFLIWSVIGVVYLIINKTLEFEFSLSFLKTIILGILNTQYTNIYWFFRILFGIYLCIPLLACVQKDLRIKVFSYVIGVSFLFNILIPFLCNVFEIGYHQRVTVPIASGYLIFVLLGYVLNKVDIPRKWRLVIYVFAVIGVLMQTIGTYVTSIEAGRIVDTYRAYTNVPCLLYSVGLFVFFKEVGKAIQNEKVVGCIEWLSSYSFAIYLMHWFVMDAMVRIFDLNTYSIIYRVGAPFVICAICIGCAWIIRKIPILKEIIP